MNKIRSMFGCRKLVVCMSALLLPMMPLQNAWAVEYVFSGFGTLGYARSNQPYDYHRFVDKKGTLLFDSVLGLQADVQFNRQWRATVQAKLDSSTDKDKHFEGSIPWALISYRPTDSVLIRAGRMRLPSYLNVENLDVGVTYDMARLPIELHSIAPDHDFDGLNIKKTWDTDYGEFSVDGFYGESDVHWRYYLRDQETPVFPEVNMEGVLLELGFQRDANLFRIGFQDQDLRVKDFTFPEYPRYVEECSIPGYPIPQSCGIYILSETQRQLNAQGYNIPGENFEGNEFRTTALSFGADIDLGNNYRLIGEYSRRKPYKNAFGPDTNGGYLSLLKRMNEWTPYVSFSRLLSSSKSRKFYSTVNENRTSLQEPPLGFPAEQFPAVVAGLNLTQRIAADSIFVYDQSTIALGTSYRLSPSQVIKAEWARTTVGSVSSFIDTPAGEESKDRNINVFSASYNFVF